MPSKDSHRKDFRLIKVHRFLGASRDIVEVGVEAASRRCVEIGMSQTAALTCPSV